MWKLKNISIRGRLISIQLATAFMAVLICCAFFVYNDIKVFKESSVSNKYSIAEIVGINATSTLEFADPEAAKEMLQKLESNPSILDAIIRDKDGKEFASYHRAGAFAFPNDVREVEKTQHNFDKNYLVTYPINNKEFLGTVILRAELTDFNSIIFGYIKIAFLILIISLLAAFFISSVLQRAITTRLLALVENAKRVTRTGNYAIRAAIGGRDEITTLAAAFNNMLDQIEKMKSDLHRANLELEERVKLRTAELEGANRELEVKSEELTRSNQELGQYAYVASHDLQEPLRTIINYVNLLEEKYADQNDDETRMYVRFVTRAAVTMRNLITHLLEFSRIGTNVTFEQVDCNRVVRELMDEMQESIKQGNVQVKVLSLPVVVGNTISLKQLMQNIISNAIKFRKPDTQAVIEINAVERPADWLFSIKDNGIGMEKKYQDKIFIIFQRLHSSSEYPGTGIGLATCKKIVQVHQGSLWVESEPGLGSTFYFTVSKNLNHP